MTEQENLSPTYVIPRNYEDSFITAGDFRSEVLARVPCLQL